MYNCHRIVVSWTRSRLCRFSDELQSLDDNRRSPIDNYSQSGRTLSFSSLPTPIIRTHGRSSYARHDDYDRHHQEDHVPVVSDWLAHRQRQASFRCRGRGPVPPAAQRVHSVSEQDGGGGSGRVWIPVTRARRVPADRRESAILRIPNGRR